MSPIQAFDQKIFSLLNALAGRSWTLDSLISLFQSNPLLRGGIPAACLFACWFLPGPVAQRREVRRKLLVLFPAALVAAYLAAALSLATFSPRPFLRTVPFYRLEKGRFHPYASRAMRLPLDRISQKRLEEMASGEIEKEDLHSFPSDSSALYAALAVVVLVADFQLGLWAALWVLGVVFPPLIILGLHYPRDVAAGAALAGLVMAAFVPLARRPRIPLRDRLVSWTTRHEGLAGSLFFVLCFETAAAWKDVPPLLHYLRVVIGNLARL